MPVTNKPIGETSQDSIIGSMSVMFFIYYTSAAIDNQHFTFHLKR